MSLYTQPEWAKSALVTIDTQCDTLDGQPLEVPGTTSLLPRIRRLLDAYRTAGLPIVHVVRLYTADGSNADLCRREALENGAQILLAGSPGSQLAPDLLPDKGARLEPDLLLKGALQSLGDREGVLYKPRWGAFFRTCLEDHLRRNEVTTVAFAGCNFPNCPRTSIYQASERDFKVVVVEDAISGLYDRGRKELLAIAANVVTTDSVISCIAGVNPNETQRQS